MNLAVIWDFDGTLIDTRQKNLNVTRKIIEHVTGKAAQDFACVSSMENYLSANSRTKNWRHLYSSEFGFDEDQIDLVGKLWTQFQLIDETPTSLFPHLKEVIAELFPIPQGIVSQNSRSNIIKILQSYKLDHYFGSIIGYEEVGNTKQKPDPTGLMKCIRKICDDKCEKVLYIGDHETDILCALNTAKIMKQIEIIPIAAYYGMQKDISSWKIQPYHILQQPTDLLKIIEDLSNRRIYAGNAKSTH